MRKLRKPLQPGTLVEVTTRTVQGRLLMVPPDRVPPDPLADLVGVDRQVACARRSFARASEATFC